ncbi:MAG TPA: TIGR02281 family clan AA aspartic protease [Allosphingosinicella sp.]|nr:TIGR02281 family clan AA aspartic protease [Allosphingosinicella sp.]
MQKAFFLVTVMGAALGLLWPGAPKPAPVAVAAAAGQPKETLLKRADSGHFYVDGLVNGQSVNFVVDTGATAVTLTVEDARRAGIQFSESDFTPIGWSASGELRGTTLVLDRVSVDGKEATGVSAAIAEGLGQSLLGQSYLSQISSVEMSGDYMRLQ